MKRPVRNRTTRAGKKRKTLSTLARQRGNFFRGGEFVRSCANPIVSCQKFYRLDLYEIRVFTPSAMIERSHRDFLTAPGEYLQYEHRHRCINAFGLRIFVRGTRITIGVCISALDRATKSYFLPPPEKLPVKRFFFFLDIFRHDLFFPLLRLRARIF